MYCKKTWKAGMLLLAGMCVLCSLPVQAAPPKPSPQAAAVDPEVMIGQKAAQEVMKEEKVVTSGPEWERVNRIGETIAQAANQYAIPASFGSSVHKIFQFHFYVVQNNDVNAFSLPGGFVFVNTGLLKFVHSDDELAAVLGHEIGHVEHHHVITLMRQQNKLQSILTPLQLAALALVLTHSGGSYTSGKQGSDLAGAGMNLMEASQLYSIARINGYRVHAEEDADHTGIMLLTHTQYDPAAMYTFMLRLSTYEREHGDQMLGIYRDHPPTPQRIAAAKALLNQLHIPIYFSVADPAWRAVVKPVQVNGQTLQQISVKGVDMGTVTAQDGQTAQQHAELIGRRINWLLDRGLAAFEIRANTATGSVVARGLSIFTQADAAACHTTLQALASQLSMAVVQVNEIKQMELAAAEN